jgi:uncharacterized protein
MPMVLTGLKPGAIFRCRPKRWWRTPDDPETFADLEAFGNNNYTRQLEDLHLLTNWVCDENNDLNAFFNTGSITLMGHSMGGGISIIHANEDSRITQLITWAAISQCKTPWGNWPPERMAAWKQSGVEYYFNSRTKQQMPLYYQLYEDYLQHQKRLDIQQAAAAIRIPWLICHGTADAAVPVQSAYDLQQWQPNARLFTVDSDHVFGRSHPWPHKYLPPAMEAVLAAGVDFLKE